MSDSAVRAYVSERRFSSATTERWLQQAPEDRDALLDLAQRLRLGENQFRDVFDQLQDVAARRSCGLTELLRSDPLQAVLRRRLGRNEMVKALKQALRRLRYPQLTTAESHLKELVRGLNLPQGVEVQLPENLESSCLTVTVRASSTAELRRRATALAAAAEREGAQEIFRVLEGEW